MRILAALASGTLLLLLSACAGEATPSTPPEKSTPAETTAAPTETKAEPGGDDDGYNKAGAVMLLESQLGAFGGQGRWDGDTLITKFDAELDASDLDLPFVCGFMDGLVLEEHSTAVETPSGTTPCTA